MQHLLKCNLNQRKINKIMLISKQNKKTVFDFSIHLNSYRLEIKLPRSKYVRHTAMHVCYIFLFHSDPSHRLTSRWMNEWNARQNVEQVFYVYLNVQLRMPLEITNAICLNGALHSSIYPLTLSLSLLLLLASISIIQKWILNKKS